MISYAFLSPEALSDADVQRFSLLLEQLVKHPVSLDRARIETVLSQAKILTARMEDGLLVGIASLYRIHLFTRTIGRIEDVVVDSEARGHGIGRELMNRLIAEAKQDKISRLFLTSSPSRIEANQLYQKIGFQPQETNPYKMDLE